MNIQEAKELHFLFFQIMANFHKKVLVNFRKCHNIEPKLKKNHSKTLHILYQKDSLTSTELGKMLDIEKGGLTTIIDQLVEMKLVHRLAAPNDRRKILLSLSAEGREFMDNVLQKFHLSLMELFKNVDPLELDQYIINMRQVANFMKKL